MLQAIRSEFKYKIDNSGINEEKKKKKKIIIDRIRLKKTWEQERKEKVINLFKKLEN